MSDLDIEINILTELSSFLDNEGISFRIDSLKQVYIMKNGAIVVPLSLDYKAEISKYEINTALHSLKLQRDAIKNHDLLKLKQLMEKYPEESKKIKDAL